jgi:enoyl-CoA hydratase
MPAPGVLRITMESPGRANGADARMHHELAYIWRQIDADAETSAVLLTGAGDAFSGRGDLSIWSNR